MIINDLYPSNSDYTIDSGLSPSPGINPIDYDTEITDGIMSLTPQDNDITKAYFLFYVEWDNIPSVFKGSIIQLTTNSIEAHVTTVPQNVAGTYMAYYTASTPATNTYRAQYDYSYSNGVMHNNTGLQYYQLVKRYYNNFSIRKAGAVSSSENGVTVYCKNDSTNTWGYNDFTMSATDFFEFLTGTGKTITISGWYGGAFPGTVVFNSVSALSFGDRYYYTEQREIDGVPYTFLITIANYYFINTRDRNYSATHDVTAYTSPTPMLRFYDNGNCHFRASESGTFGIYNMVTSYHMYNNFIRFNPTTGVIVNNDYFSIGETIDSAPVIFGGLEFSLDRSEVVQAVHNSAWVNGNCIIFKEGQHLYIRRMYKPSEVLTHARLCTSYDKTVEFDFSSNKLIPLFDENNKFLNEWVSGTFEDIEDVLRPWQYETIRSNILDPDNIPAYNPDPPSPEPPSEDKYKKVNILWEQLLYHIHNGIYNDSPEKNHLGIRESDLEKFGKESLIKFISERADLDFNNENAKNFFDIYINNINDNGDRHWNESIAKLADYYYKIFYTNEMDNQKIADSEMTFGDLKRADAGNSFTEEPYVKPDENDDGNKYLDVRGNDAIIRVLEDISNLQFTQNFDGGKISQYLRLIMPEYKREIEIEDINRNFWVIGQALTTLFAFIFDDDSIYPALLLSLLDEIVQLWENIFYLWLCVGLLSIKEPYEDIKIIFLPVSNNNYFPIIDDERTAAKVDDIKFDDFSLNYSSILYYYEEEENETEHMREIKERRIREKNIQILRKIWQENFYYLISKYNNCALVIIPEIREQNYAHNYYSKAAYPGIIFYDDSVYDEKDLPIYAPFKYGIIVDVEEQKIHYAKEKKED